jgi:hypothetical protein
MGKVRITLKYKTALTGFSEYELLDIEDEGEKIVIFINKGRKGGE